MTRPVRFDVAAHEEIDAAVHWYDAQTERTTLSDDRLDEVAAVVAALGERPESFALAAGVPERLGVRTASLGRFPFRLIFLLLADHVRVLALAHHRRRPGYWRFRL